MAMAAGRAALEQLLETGFYEKLEARTQKFVKVIQDYCDQKQYEVSIPQLGSIFWIAFSRERIIRADQIDAGSMEKFKRFHLECLQRGIYFGPSGYEVGFVSAAHSERDLADAADRICDALDVVFGE